MPAEIDKTPKSAPRTYVVAPRLVARPDAAHYVGIKPTLFDDLVAEGGLGEDAPQRDDERFLEETSPDWPLAGEFWRREHRKKIGPPVTQSEGRRGWYFPAAMLAAIAAARGKPEAAE